MLMIPLYQMIFLSTMNTVYHHHADKYEEKCWTCYYEPAVYGHAMFILWCFNLLFQRAVWYDLTMGVSECYDLFLYFYDVRERPLVLFSTLHV